MSFKVGDKAIYVDIHYGIWIGKVLSVREEGYGWTLVKPESNKMPADWFANEQLFPGTEENLRRAEEARVSFDRLTLARNEIIPNLRLSLSR